MVNDHLHDCYYHVLSIHTKVWFDMCTYYCRIFDWCCPISFRGLMDHCSSSNALAMELLQPYSPSSIWFMFYVFNESIKIVTWGQCKCKLDNSCQMQSNAVFDISRISITRLGVFHSTVCYNTMLYIASQYKGRTLIRLLFPKGYSICRPHRRTVEYFSGHCREKYLIL